MRAAACLFACALVGCSVIAPTVAQLERMKREAAAGDRQAVARETVLCDSGEAICAQLHLLRGDACFGLMPGKEGSTRRWLDRCAAQEFAAGLDALKAEQTPLGPRRDYAAKQLEVLRDLIDTRTVADDAGTLALASAALAFRGRYPADPAGSYYLATAQLSSAQDHFFAEGDKGALCTALTSISPHDGAPDGAFAVNFRQLDASIRGMHAAGGCR